MKKLFTTLVLLLACTAMSYAEDFYGLVGDFSGGWDNDIEMTAAGENVYTLTISDKVIESEKLTYEYKFRKNKIWSGDGSYVLPAGDNASYTFPEAGTYDLTFTADISKHTLMLTVVKHLTATPDGTSIWEGTQELNWNNGASLALEAAKFESAKVGDKVHVALSKVTLGGLWDAQVAFADASWKNFEEGKAVGDGNTSELEFVITGDILKELKANGARFTGVNNVVNKVTLETVGTEPASSDNSIWFGSQALTWTQVEIFNGHFVHSNIQAGQYIKFTFEAGASPYISLLWDWEHEDKDDNKPLIHVYGNAICGTGVAYYKVTEADLPHLTNIDFAKGSLKFIINANDITLTKVEVVPQPDFYIIADKGSGWEVDGAMTGDAGVFTGSVENANYFAIAPAFALNGDQTAITEWNFVECPVSNDNFVVNFQNYAAKTTIANGKVWAINADADIKDVNISFTPASSDYTLSCTNEVEIGATGYATYSNDYKYKVENATANFVTVAGDVATLVPQDASAVLPNKAVTNAAGKNSGIIISGTPSTTAIIRSVASDAAVVDGVSANLLAGSGNATYDISTQFAGDDKYIAYILAKPAESALGFYKSSLEEGHKTLAAHKAFLAVPNNGGQAPSFIGFGDVTAIEGIEAAKANVVEGCFNLAGQRVAQPTKGLYIVNGKKVVMK